MNPLVIASCNHNKTAEIRAILGGIYARMLSMTEAGFSGEIEETGATFRDNAILKARVVMEATGMDSLADDSGLEVFALGGAPGVLSARYSGRHGDDAANNEKLLRDMERLTGRQRDAQYACCIALARPGLPILTAEGTCPGTILR
ncbi:MAG: non-canonical purine NTP pyrophosphatase, partial [Clostridiales bacterium]|nr:non-canonical purine NTP pyrophosphatase [Clostridiales bacterium]